jgi:molybdopterin biosynthesis enzyme
MNIFTGYENNNRIYGKLENEISSDPFSTSVIIARVEHTEAGNLIFPVSGKISGKISALLAGDAYIVMAEGTHVYKRGDTLEAHEGGW